MRVRLRGVRMMVVMVMIPIGRALVHQPRGDERIGNGPGKRVGIIEPLPGLVLSERSSLEGGRWGMLRMRMRMVGDRVIPRLTRQDDRRPSIHLLRSPLVLVLLVAFVIGRMLRITTRAHSRVLPRLSAWRQNGLVRRGRRPFLVRRPLFGRRVLRRLLFTLPTP